MNELHSPDEPISVIFMFLLCMNLNLTTKVFLLNFFFCFWLFLFWLYFSNMNICKRFFTSCHTVYVTNNIYFDLIPQIVSVVRVSIENCSSVSDFGKDQIVIARPPATFWATTTSHYDFLFSKRNTVCFCIKKKNIAWVLDLHLLWMT